MLNEFRQDPVSGDWVLFAEKRASRPHALVEKKPFFQPKENCPFEGDFKDQGMPFLIWNHGNPVALNSKEWTIRVIENKFPALMRGMCSPVHQEELFAVAAGFGSHELVVTPDHERQLAQFTQEELAEVLKAYQARYIELSKDPCTKYVSIFHNHGLLAGASVYHNHSQILSMPMLPSLIERSIVNARAHLIKTGTPIYDELLRFQLKDGKRVVFENQNFVAFCPFVSRAAYEVRIFPKAKQASFGELENACIPELAEALGAVLKKLHEKLDDPDFIFFLRTAPVNDQVSHEEYRWHLEIMPRDSVIAGFEVGANILVNAMDPDEAAEKLRAI